MIRELSEELPVRLRYFLRIANVGDRISPLVVNALGSAPTRFVLDTDSPHLLAAGSIMACAEPTSIVWGTGIMHPDMGLGRPKAENVYAVRGRLSAEALHAAGILKRDVPFGDPALLAPAILGIETGSVSTFPLGIVPHYVDRRHPGVKRLLAMEGVCDLDVHKEPAEFLEAMSHCRAVVSSSLHGLIFAEALGLPTLWFKATNDVAGEGFKFRDWFSTTLNPQTSPLCFKGREDPEQLVSMAERRYSSVCKEEFASAFPRDRLAEIRDSSPVKIASQISRHPRQPVPVFVISFNRGAQLMRCLNGLRHLSRPTLPIIHDNGSTDPATQKILSKLEADGVRIYRRHAITSADDLNSVNHTVADFFSDQCEPSRYIVTDCDIDMSAADPTSIDVYDELLNIFRRVECVGPMLRIRDIARSYPLYCRAMNRHIELLWRNRPLWVETERGRVAVQEFPIDTTFALHRAGEPFRRLKKAVRVYEPYEAVHLDWYEDTRCLDKAYPDTSHPAISHWNNRIEKAARREEGLKYDRFYAVRRHSNGSLEEYVCHIAAPRN